MLSLGTCRGFFVLGYAQVDAGLFSLILPNGVERIEFLYRLLDRLDV